MSARLLWFGLAAPPLAWVVQLVGGWLLDEAACGRGSHDWGIDDHLWQGVLSGAAIVVAATGLAAAWSSWQAVHAGAADARGRADFLATAALSAAPVFLLLTIITLAGVLAVEPCRG